MSRLLGVALVLLALAALVSLAWAHRLTRPVERLTEATREIAKGRFEIRVDAVGGDEIGQLAGSFNQMAVELKDREDALEQAQAQLVQSAKMAAFGELGAGIAHEVKNPLAGILGCAQLGLRKAEEGSAVHKNLVLIEKETKRCKSIIDNLMRFARNEKAVHEPIDVNQAVDAAVAIVHHQLEMSGVKLDVMLADDLPEINGSSNQIQQVLMNLIMNAQQAMEDNPGTVTVTTRRDGAEAIEIVVADDGPGIPPEIREHIFEPFFTTKPSGKGTGLGLSVSFGIVRDHNGEIHVESEPGKGTRFVIALPVPVEQSLLEALGTQVAAAAEAVQAR
jgi:signal transduction histidine kinase